MNPTHVVAQSHLRRKAYLYIRQSTILQTEQNVESTQRQYGFKEQAVALGWAADQIEVIDDDLGQSGAAAAGRDGFARLVTDVGLGKVGIVLALEASRLARNCSDWHRLLEICALSDTLIMDEDGVYNPNNFNDRLLLGLRGTMSEAELHFLRCRLEGGKLNKAKRGELRLGLPAGLVYEPDGRVVLDPDRQVQQTIRCVFETFARTQSAWGTVRQLARQGIQLPVRIRSGPTAGDLAWVAPAHSRILNVLRNPRYAGAYFYGRSQWRRGAQRDLPREQWEVLIREAHAGYITWEQYEANLQVLLDNRPAEDKDQPRLRPGEGPALLQGVVICGRCGRRMTVRYEQRRGCLFPDYSCGGDRIQHSQPICQRLPGASVDRAVAELLVAAVTPQAVQAALEVFEDLRRRQDEAEALYRCQIERAEHEAQLAQRQFLLAHPENRLVVDTLEKRWNEKLAAMKAAQDSLANWKQRQTVTLSHDGRQRILSLAQDFGAVWHHPNTSDRDRKRMLRLLIEDVTLTRGTDIRAQVRWRGGATSELRLPIPLSFFEARRTPADLTAYVAGLVESHDDIQTAEILNREHRTTGAGQAFTAQAVRRVRCLKGIPNYQQHLRRKGWLTVAELRQRWGLAAQTITHMRRRGMLQGIQGDRRQWLYQPPSEATLQYLNHWRRLFKLPLADCSSSNARGAV
jgi:DNA invertase Pin-like site-specific DNA recombinase